MCSAERAAISLPVRNSCHLRRRAFVFFAFLTATAMSAHFREEWDGVLSGPALFLAHLDESAGRADLGALEAPLAVLVVDPQ